MPRVRHRDSPIAGTVLLIPTPRQKQTVGTQKLAPGFWSAVWLDTALKIPLKTVLTRFEADWNNTTP
jgi:hypothetical protein